MPKKPATRKKEIFSKYKTLVIGTPDEEQSWRALDAIDTLRTRQSVLALAVVLEAVVILLVILVK